MPDTSYFALMRASGFGLLILFCGGIWLFAADGLIVATMLPDILGEIDGANLVGLMGAAFESGAIVAGALSTFMVRRTGIRASFCLFAALFALACLVGAIAQDMPVFMIGRLLQALAGGGLISIAFIAVGRLFDASLMARAFGVVSIVWGTAAFSGPLVGGLAVQFANWRLAFVYAAIIALVLCVSGWILMGRRRDLLAEPERLEREPFPIVRMILLSSGILAVAAAGVFMDSYALQVLIGAGVIAICLFVWRDNKSGSHALLPRDLLHPASRVGSAFVVVIFISAASLGIGLFSPVLVSALYGWPPVMIGYAMFLGAFGWTIAATLLAGTPVAREHLVIVSGVLVSTAGIAGFSVGFHFDLEWLLWASYLVQGAGIGAAWTFIIRRASASAVAQEKDRIQAAIPTAQRFGLAISAAVLGIVANHFGFAAEMDVQTARSVTYWVFGLSVPMALIAVIASLVFVWPELTVSKRSVTP